jgi:cell wall-associated NlpC family hydrolase
VNGAVLSVAGGVVLLPAVLIGAATGALTTGTGTGSGSLLAQIPATYLALYEAAAGRCPGLPWTVLAAVGTVESGNGQNTAVSSAGAVGPMQFEPATWARWGVDGDGDGVKDPRDPADAIPAAADYLCASGARGGRNIPAALFAYNHSGAYVQQVLADAAELTADLTSSNGGGSGGGGTVVGGGTASPAAAAAVAFAVAQVGVPYQWGGDGPAAGQGFDCSGLTQAAYAAAGLALPRTAQGQYDATPRLAAGAALEPGDLLFFGATAGAITHVGLYVGGGLMVDAPHTGADVRTEPYRWSDYLAATRPT